MEPEGRPTVSLSLAEQELFDRVGWYIRLRWLALLAIALTLLVAWYGLGLRFSVWPLVAVILTAFFYNAVFALFAKMVRDRRTVTPRFIVVFANVQIAMDLLALGVFIHFAGGVVTLRIMLFLIPIIMAAELLSLPNAYLQATFAALLVNGVCWLEYLGVLHHHELVGLFPGPVARTGSGLHQEFLYVLTVTSIGTAALYVAVFMASSIAARLRAREGDLERAYHRLQAVDSEKSYFMRRAGHGLRSPLAAIQSLLRLISQGFAGEVDSRPRELITRAVGRTDELIALVNDLLRYSRLQAVTEPEARQHVSLEALLADTVAVLQPLADEKGLSLEVSAQPATVLGDPEDLGDLVANLVGNAIKYTLEGGEVRVRLWQEEEWVRLEVSDTGIGVPPEARQHIFEEFYRASNAKSVEPGGTGLGLAIVKRVVTVHGGEVGLTSTPGTGSIFSVRLPASEQPTEPTTGWPPPETF